MNDLTPHLGLPLPHPANDLESDVQRLRDALSMLDIAVASKAAAAEVEAALAQLLDSAPDALNSLRELAAALGLDACAMEGIDHAAIDTALGLQARDLRCVLLVALGYRSSADFNAALPKSRLPEAAVISEI